MVSNEELEAGLRAMAEDFHLPGGGRKKLPRLVAGHLAWFDTAEQRGMSWRDMTRALTAVGVGDRGAMPLSVGTLSSTVLRKRAETELPVGRPDRQEHLATFRRAAGHPERSRGTKRPPTGQLKRKHAASEVSDSRPFSFDKAEGFGEREPAPVK